MTKRELIEKTVLELNNVDLKSGLNLTNDINKIYDTNRNLAAENGFSQKCFDHDIWGVATQRHENKLLRQ